ncbi:sugar phosphate nucleotidyltransferase [Conexibacter sp. SYSU D00693]|uniref:sugar phosphate nucleotidyltransferase n=1 Tax=Conexibacter sp. SYSU D00693 TaxID=2812560 RepID=UPI00196B2F72|nr:sugar phosphate nucleotidyltransferase [Conexibacter sp. SYSU D00693]
MDSPPPVAILCGGRGTRLQEHTRTIPKPLVEIGGHPIVWHVVQIYAQHGFRDFLLLTGYLADQMEEFAAQTPWPEGVTVRCLDTGLDTPTGGRVAKAAEELGGGTFCLTYADGVADLDLGALLDFHRAHGAAATVTVVRPELQFGVLDLDGDDKVTGFREKPRSEHWINGGFFVFEPRVLDVVHDDVVLEREPLEQLAGEGELRAFRHGGFWDCMDTYKDSILLNDLWASGDAPWRTWA